MESDLIEAHVANVLNARELVITAGTNQGVELGMRFRVLASEPTEITHPESGEIIGVLDREKIRVEITEIQDNISIGRTYETRRVGGMGVRIPSLEPARNVPVTLRAGDEAYLPPISERESFIKRGDRVVELWQQSGD